MSSHKSRLVEFKRKASATGRVVLIGPMGQLTPPADLLTTSAVMGVDGGSERLDPALYHYTIGDGDSLRTGPRPVLDEIHPVEKDQSDLHLALRRIPADVAEIHLWGFWEGRLDHQLVNLGEINQFLLNHQAVISVHIPGSLPLTARPAGLHQVSVSGTFSLLSLQESHFRITGPCRYPLPSPTKVAPFSAHLLSNEGRGTVEIESTQPFFYYSPAGSP